MASQPLLALPTSKHFKGLMPQSIFVVTSKVMVAPILLNTLDNLDLYVRIYRAPTAPKLTTSYLISQMMVGSNFRDHVTETLQVKGTWRLRSLL